jgi:hypothetical protein
MNHGRHVLVGTAELELAAMVAAHEDAAEQGRPIPMSLVRFTRAAKCHWEIDAAGKPSLQITWE